MYRWDAVHIVATSSTSSLSKAHAMRDSVSSSFLQVVQVYLHSGHVCTTHSWNVCHSRKLQKYTKSPYFGGSGSFKVIVVDIKKLIISACYDKQYVCVYVQLFSC